MSAAIPASAKFYDSLRTHFAPAIPHCRELGLTVERLDAAGALGRIPYREHWLGDPQRGIVHTGIITTLVDTVSGLAAVGASGAFEVVATLDLRMDFLRPARAGADLLSFAECYRLTRSIAFVRARAWQDNESEPVAVAQVTFMRSGPSKRGPGQPP